jgi:hypothetical protein
MSKLSEIENSIATLKEEEYLKFREWFLEYENEKWDNKIANSGTTNKLSDMAQQAIDDFKKGNFKSL